MLQGIMGKCMRWCHNKAVGLLVLRVVLGGFFIVYGVTMFQNLEMMKEAFTLLGFSASLAILVAACEVFAGAAILLGAFLWPAAGLITIIMGVAIWKVTGPNMQETPFLIHAVTGWGENLVYAAAAIALAFCGAGRYSLTNLYFRRRAVACRDCMADHGHGHDCPDCSHATSSSDPRATA